MSEQERLENVVVANMKINFSWKAKELIIQGASFFLNRSNRVILAEIYILIWKQKTTTY